MRYFVGILLLIVLLGAAGAVFSFGTHTEFSFPILFGGSILVACATAYPLRRFWGWLTGTPASWVNIPLHVVAATLLLAGGLFAVNYLTADFDNPIPVEGEIVRRYTKTRHKSHRVGRRYSSTGAPYKVYYVEIHLQEFPADDSPGNTPFAGKTIEENIPVGLYTRLRTGDTVTIPTSRGLLGLPVRKVADITVTRH